MEENFNIIYWEQISRASYIFWAGVFLEALIMIYVFRTFKKNSVLINGQIIFNPKISRIICYCHFIILGIMTYCSITWKVGFFGTNQILDGNLNYFIGWIIGLCSFGAFIEARKPYPLAPYDFKP